MGDTLCDASRQIKHGAPPRNDNWRRLGFPGSEGGLIESSKEAK